MTTPGVSLSQHGLRAPHGLECPTGGFHHVSEGEVVVAAARGEGYPMCRKCHRQVRLVAIEREQESPGGRDEP